MPEPVNNVWVLPIWVKVAMAFVTLVGLAGGCMSIAGPVVGLTLNPNDLTATNFQQVERFGLDAALYFDCGELSGPDAQVLYFDGPLVSVSRSSFNKPGCLPALL